MIDQAAIAGFSKCHCQHCNGHIEFESVDAGRTIACPHCELDTVLFIPGAGKGALRLSKTKRKLPWMAITLGAVIVLAIGALLVVMFRPNSKGAQVVEAGAGVTGITLVGLWYIVMAVIGLVIAILWVAFPLFMYFHTKRTNELLEKIERNTRPR